MKEDSKKLADGKEPEFKKLNIRGDTYYTRYTKKYENRTTWSRPDVKNVISFIPGTIRQILVKVGDTVDVEQKLLILEAMKMMNTIYSPLSGKIKSIKVEVGDCVPKGTLMIEFE